MKKENLKNAVKNSHLTVEKQVSIEIGGELFGEELEYKLESADYRNALLNLTVAEFLKKMSSMGMLDKSQSEDIGYMINDYLERGYSEPVEDYIPEFEYDDIDFM